jgi:spore germination protein
MSKYFKIGLFLSLGLILTGSLGWLWGSLTPKAEATQTSPKREMIRWGYYVRTQSSLESLRANIDSLTMISPFYFVLKADGTIGGSDQPEVTQLAKSRGVKVLPMIQNDQYTASKEAFHNLLANPEKVRQIIDAIEAQVLTYGYDGYNIDFENILPQDRPLLTQFMESLYKRLKPRGKLVTMAVAGKVKDTTGSWGGAYDYAGLSPYLDYAVIMAYDYSYPGGKDGPVAPLNWVSSVAAFAGSQFGPGKVLLGVPFYGHDWSLNGGKSRSHSYETILDLVRQNNGSMGYDDVTQQAFADFTQENDRRRVWFETPRSIGAKLDVIRKNNLGGWAAWRLGQEGRDFWPILNRY